MPYWIHYFLGTCQAQPEHRATLDEAIKRANFMQDQWAVNGASCHYRIYYGPHLAASSFNEALAVDAK